MSYERMEKRAAELEAEVAKWLSTAEAADAEEDKLHGHDRTGEEMPDWVADKKRRDKAKSRQSHAPPTSSSPPHYDNLDRLLAACREDSQGQGRMLCLLSASSRAPTYNLILYRLNLAAADVKPSPMKAAAASTMKSLSRACVSVAGGAGSLFPWAGSM
jgi:hypothetical protein